MKKFLLITLILLNIPLFAFDLNDLGDFSSRSVIESKLYNKEKITQDQKDILKSKKLTPTPQCMIEQIKKGSYENVELLLQSKVNPNQHYYSEYAIYIAARENKFDILKLLYEYNAKLDRGFNSELFAAVKNKNKEMAQYLLDRGAKVNYTDSITNDTILYAALKNKMYDIASQLIQKGAYADIRSVKYMKKHKLGYLIEEKN